MQFLFAVLFSAVCFRVLDIVPAPVPYPVTTNWRQTGWDMGIDGYAETGWIDMQVNRN